MSTFSEVNTLIEGLFREEYSKIVSFLTSRFGIDFLDMAQDVAQDTLMTAVKNWSDNTIPDNPKAWLFTVAKNKAINALNRDKKRLGENQGFSFEKNFENSEGLEFEEEIKDGMLKMMFVCCSDTISPDCQITLILSTLCGFSRKEIAKALISEEEAIKKRLYRSKKILRDHKIQLELPDRETMESRIESVNKALYLLFNEGYNSSIKEEIIRKDVCLEALRLTKLLTEHFQDSHSTRALFALMCFHIARFESRLDNQGYLVLFDSQNRTLWNRKFIEIGIIELSKSSKGNWLSPYHLEAGIALEHCTTKNFEETNWQKIKALYTHLLKIKDSPVIKLNLAIVEGILSGPKLAISRLKAILEEHPNFKNHYLIHASLGEFHLRDGNGVKATEHFTNALHFTENKSERKLIQRKMSETLV